MPELNTLLDQLRDGFTEIFEIEAPGADADLIDGGILDSFQLVELLTFLDLRFGLKVELEQMELDDLRTLERLTRLIAKNRH